MSTRLVLLGLLKHRPLYGYELKHIIESHMGDWTNIAFGSIYFALKKLTEEDLVRQIATEQEGNRPSRRVYEITTKGRDEFQKLLENLWRTPVREYYSFDIGLFFIREIPKEKRLPLLRERIEWVKNGLEHLEQHGLQVINNPHVPKEASALFSHSRYHMKAEMQWLEEIQQAIERGEY